MKKNIKHLVFLSFIISLLIFPSYYLYASLSDTTSGGTTLTNPVSVTSIPALIGQVINVALGLVGSLALLMFIYGGFVWMLSAGNSQNVQKGKQILVWATIGIVTIFASYTLVKFIMENIIGLS